MVDILLTRAVWWTRSHEQGDRCEDALGVDKLIWIGVRLFGGAYQWSLASWVQMPSIGKSGRPIYLVNTQQPVTDLLGR